MRATRILAVVAFALAGMLIFARLGALPLLQPDEGRNAEVAREMMVRGAWLVPTYDGLPYLDKPAFYFRAVAISLSAFGTTEMAARLPSALSALLLLALLFAFCVRTYTVRTAALAVIVVGTTPLYIAFSRIVIFDMMLALFVCASIFAAYLAEEPRAAARNWYLASAAAAGVATLIKGPVGFLIPLLVVLVFNRVDGRRGAWRRLLAPANLFVFVAIVLPWFVALSVARPDFPYYGVVRESLSRFATGSFRRTAPFYYYVPVIAGVFFPWSVLLPEGMVLAWRLRTRWTSADRLLIIWAAVVVMFFSISQSKLPGYVLTAVIALGILMARLLSAALDGRNAPSARAALRGAVVLAVVCAMGAAVLAVDRAVPGGLRQVLHLRSKEIVRLQPLFLPVMWSLAGIAALALAARLTGSVRMVILAFLLFPLSLLTVSFPALRQYAAAGSSALLAARLPEMPPDTRMACLQCFPNGLPFYTGDPVTVVTRSGGELTSNYIVFTLQRTVCWPGVVVRLGERDSWLSAQRRPVFLMARSNERSALDSIAAARGARLLALTSGWWGALLMPRGGG